MTRLAGSLFSYVGLEERVRAHRPLRVIRGMVNAMLVTLSPEFDALYSLWGRASIPPERLLRALLLQAFHSLRSERQLVERIEFDLLFRWFVGLGVDDPVWDATTFTKNRDRLLAGDVAAKFLATVLASERQNAALDRAFLSGWHTPGSVVQHQELPAEKWFGYTIWSGLLHRSAEAASYISATPLTAARAAEAVRANWRIETTSHCSRDVTMGGVAQGSIRDRGWNGNGGEDRSRIRTNPGAARLRSFGFNILKANRIGTLSQDRYRAALDGPEDLLKLLAVS